ncbi:hypothetical protein A1Q2_05721 [Trichosporon asahii var. asahii CBS 8904]|uniref:Uncharacterized protein n=1 Tax=Trichosporon asahii var. asahii (strain CBS 8904) TaxID=1220162 RepID=K1VTE0_TRIAC|nr:hypothetical protein A1Q2_05721 [Trichosporon asahii var. asahii CBS 8904]
MPQTILDAIAADTRPAPPAAAPAGMVYHSHAEYSANRGRLNDEYRPIGSTIVDGTNSQGPLRGGRGMGAAAERKVSSQLPAGSVAECPRLRAQSYL